MRKLIKPASILMHFLSLLVFFLAGLFYARIIGAGKDQGLAGGAIVFGYGIVFAFTACIVSLIFSYYTRHKNIVIANRILLIVLAVFVALFIYLYTNKAKAEKSPGFLSYPSNKMYEVKETYSKTQFLQDTGSPMGLGFFKPDFYNTPVLYFYGYPSFEKPVNDHSPVDSIVFKRIEDRGFDISYAPPWLKPDHLKLDYGILYFRVLSVGRDFAEIFVNDITHKIIFVDRNAGEIKYWPDFLMSINSVEFIASEKQKILIKPLKYAGEVKIPYEFMRPQLIKNEWMLVSLLDTNFQSVGTGWIQWKRDNKLLITYSLLS